MDGHRLNDDEFSPSLWLPKPPCWSCGHSREEHSRTVPGTRVAYAPASPGAHVLAGPWFEVKERHECTAEGCSCIAYASLKGEPSELFDG